jgi:ferric-dicitrate binding protein FerR (iron transport regulator)
MKSAEDIRDLVKKAAIDSNPDVNSAVLQGLLEELDECDRTDSAAAQVDVRRRIVKSRITKLAAAAAMIVAVLVVIRWWSGVEMTGVAWAKVAENVEKAQAFTFHEKEVETGADGTSERDRTIYVCSQYGLRMDNHEDGQVAISTYGLVAEKAIITVCHPMKIYTRSEMPEKEIEALKQTGPKELVRRFMSADYKKLGRKEINGVQVEGIEVTDPTLMESPAPVKSLVARLWVSVETGFPVLFESEVVMESNGPVKVKTVMDNFQWDVELAADVFEPRIPNDYRDMASALAAEIRGPQTHSFGDGSVVRLAKGASIRLYDSPDKRGFEHIEGEIEVVVAEAPGGFVVTTAFGKVSAVGTVFTMDLVSSTAENSAEKIEILAVMVKEGAVEVSNREGSAILRENQSVTVVKNEEPYDFRQDENLPPRLIQRIQAMLDAFEAGDKRAWVANFNIKAAYDLGKGLIKGGQHPWFSRMSDSDVQRLRKSAADVNGPDEMVERAVATVNINKPERIYVQSVTMAVDGKHATARCVRVRGERRYLVTTPQWTYFDDDWWQTDD